MIILLPYIKFMVENVLTFMYANNSSLLLHRYPNSLECCKNTSFCTAAAILELIHLVLSTSHSFFNKVVVSGIFLLHCFTAKNDRSVPSARRSTTNFYRLYCVRLHICLFCSDFLHKCSAHKVENATTNMQNANHEINSQIVLASLTI